MLWTCSLEHLLAYFIAQLKFKMNVLEQRLAAMHLFPLRSWLDALPKGPVEKHIQALLQEDFRQVIDKGRLQKLNFSQEVRLTKLERPLAVQILQAINIGVAKRDLAEDGDLIGADDEEEKKFETKYLDPNLMKEKKKQNKDASRMMKLSLTDGLN